MDETQLLWLCDRLAIQDVIARYSLGQDRHQGDDHDILADWDTVFTPGGTTDYSVAGSPACSYRELANWMRGLNGGTGVMLGFAGWQHMLSLPIITIDGDSATARTDYLAIHSMKSPQGGRMDSAGAFHDQLIRTPEGWRIKHRRLEVYFNDAIATERIVL